MQKIITKEWIKFWDSHTNTGTISI